MLSFYTAIYKIVLLLLYGGEVADGSNNISRTSDTSIDVAPPFLFLRIQ